MRLLFDNLAETGGLSALYENANYPVSNLVSKFLRKRFQSLQNSDTVTLLFSSQLLIDSIFYGYTNATVTIRVYNGVTLLSTDETSFAPVLADKVEFDLVATAPAYLGGIGVGLAYEMNPPTSFWDEGYTDRSIVSESQSGQVLQEYVEPLKEYAFTWELLQRAKAREFLDKYRAIGVGHTFWIAPDTDDLDWLYTRFSDAIGASKNKRQYTVSATFREAR